MLIVLGIVGAVVLLTLVGKELVSRGPAETPSLVNPADPPGVQLEQALAEERVVLVLFQATTCIPCQQMMRIVAEVLPEFEGRLVFIDVDVYQEASISLIRQMQIRVVPTSLIIDGAGEVRMYQGVIPRDLLREELQGALDR
jgi:thioredoxin-like negative regulator of GroEL